MKTLIHQAEIVNENRRFFGSILIENGVISRIIREDEPVAFPNNVNVIEANGRLLLPGTIDDQVHFREPGLTHKADIHSESRAAVAGGMTSFMEMPNTLPQTTTNALVREKWGIAADSSVTNYSFYLGATNDNIEEIKAVDPSTVCGIKLFMGVSTGNMFVEDEKALAGIFASSPILLACHCEDEETIRNNLRSYIEEYGHDLPIEYHPLIRSREACYKSSSLAVSLAKKYNTRLHILHLSTAAETGLFDNAVPLQQKKITSEVCVHHLWFDDTDYKQLGSLIKWNPAIKTAFDRKSLIESVNNDKIDIIATDHAPHTLEEKGKEYTKSPSGGPLVQHSLVAMLELWHNGTISLEKIVEKMCHNPAILFKIENRGFIREGFKADLCLVNTASKWEVGRKNIMYKCGWSPFDGQTFSSKVDMTFVNGNLVWDHNKICDDQKGELLTFKR